MTKAPFTPSPTQVRELDQSFAYEVGVLMGQAQLYLDRGHALSQDPDLAAVPDALFDSLLVRFRALESFLANFAGRPKEGQPPNAIAEHLIDGWSRRPLTPLQRNMVNERVAHLTYLRPVEHEWPIGEMVSRTLKACRDFIADRPNAPAAWKRRLREIDEVLQTWGDRNRIWTSKDNHAHRR